MCEYEKKREHRRDTVGVNKESQRMLSELRMPILWQNNAIIL